MTALKEPKYVMPQLTDEQKKFAASVKEAIKNVEQAEDVLWELREMECNHIYVPNSITTRWDSHVKYWEEEFGTAVCLICKKDGGSWYCPYSPDHLCDYSESDDEACRYCGEPDERK